MLVLSRKIGERIMIGRDIVITIASFDRRNVRLGIDAPDDVTVHREEVFLSAGGPVRRRKSKAPMEVES